MALAAACTGNVVHTMPVALGLSALIVAAPAAFLALKVTGAAYLAWLAHQAIRHGSALTLPDGAPVRAGLAATWVSGVAINLLNPTILLFFMTFLPQFVDAGDPDAAAKLVTLGILFIVISLFITVPMILAADRVALALRGNPRITHSIDDIIVVDQRLMPPWRSCLPLTSGGSRLDSVRPRTRRRFAALPPHRG